ncbi:MAG: cupin domain-containing protein [Patescibacteria group bacterium]
MKAYVVRASERTVEHTSHGTHTIKEVICRGDVLPGVTQIAIATLPEGPVGAEMHRHSTMWECYVVLEGEADYYVDDKIVRVGPGDFIAIPPGALHNQVVIVAPFKIFYWGIAVD